MKFSKYLLFFLSFSFFLFFWSSIELTSRGIIDLEGDAVWYFETAISKTYSENFYPIYPLFITYIGLDNPFLTRLWQFIFLLILALYTFIIVDTLDWSDVAKKLFKLFYVTNFGVYLLMIQLVRDWMIFSLTSLVIVLFYSNTKFVFKYMAILLCLLLLVPVSQVLPAVLAISLLLAHVDFKALYYNSFRSFVLFVFLSFLVYFFFGDYFSALFNRMDSVFGEDAVLQDSEAKDNVLIGFFNFLFGPGLVRPLFPAKYYLVYTYYFSFLTWIACLSFFVQFSFGFSMLMRSSLRKLNWTKRFNFSFLAFLFYVLVYAAAFGGPGGLRKRAIAYFLFSISMFEILNGRTFTITSGLLVRFIFIFFGILMVTTYFSF